MMTKRHTCHLLKNLRNNLKKLQLDKGSRGLCIIAE